MTTIRSPRPQGGRRSGPGRAHDRAGREGAGDDGAVTVETAVVLPAVVLLLAVLLACGGAAMLQVRCEEAAGAAARVMARGEPADAARQEAKAIAGDSARVAVDRQPDRATAAVTLPAPGILGQWDALEVSAQATTFSEEVIVDVG